MNTTKFRTLLHCQILEEHNCLTEEDFKVICEEIKRAGMGYKYVMSKAIPSIGFIDVYYKKPHEFVDANGIKFCVGPYKRTMDPKKISNKIGTFTISKDYRRKPRILNPPFLGQLIIHWISNCTGMHGPTGTNRRLLATAPPV